MIIDSIVNAEKYSAIHPLFLKAFDFLRKSQNLKDGRYEVEGDDLFVIVSENELRPVGKLEAHRKYIDIQLVISGEEVFQCGFTEKCSKVAQPYIHDSDIMFFDDIHSIEYHATPGSMSIFFPEDAHAPLIGSGIVRKAIAKVKI